MDAHLTQHLHLAERVQPTVTECIVARNAVGVHIEAKEGTKPAHERNNVWGNIVADYDSGFYHGRFCIALELVDGEDLGTLIERSGPLSEGMVWRMARQIAAALAHIDAD